MLELRSTFIYPVFNWAWKSLLFSVPRFVCLWYILKHATLLYLSNYIHSETQLLGRSLFCLGLLLRYGYQLILTSENQLDFPKIITLLQRKYLLREDFSLKVRALQVCEPSCINVVYDMILCRLWMLYTISRIKDNYPCIFFIWTVPYKMHFFICSCRLWDTYLSRSLNLCYKRKSWIS